MKPVALLILLAAPLLVAADMQVTDSPMYGRLLVMSAGQTRLEVALTEGARIVSWKVDGHEIGFVGRVWGGDMYDRYTVNGTNSNTRLRSPVAVETLRTDDGVAVRAKFAVADGVVLERTLGVGPDGVAIEARFIGADTAFYTFSNYVVRPRGTDAELRYPPTVAPLRPKEEYPGLPRDLAITGLAPVALVWHLGDGLALSPQVWDYGMDLRFGGEYTGKPLRLLCQPAPAAAIATALPAAPPFPTWQGTWEAVDFAAPEPTRPEMPAIAREYGSYGVCNGLPAYMAPLAATGLRWVRLGGFSWANCEAQPGVRDYSAAETGLASAEREGLAVVGMINGNPGWATTSGSRLAPPKDWTAWERHVEQVVARFRDRVHVWEIWNEPDIEEFWTGSAEEYVELLKHAYAGAKRADPGCLVMSAGLDGSGEVFLNRILGLGAGEYCDLIGAHPYAGSSSLAAYRLRLMRRILTFHHLAKPLWVTEVGWQSGGWKGGPGMVASEEAKGARLRESYPPMAEQADIVCWYKGVEPGQMYGLLQPTGTAGFVLNPAWFAMRELALTPAPGIRIEAGDSLAVTAGKAAELAVTVHTDRPVRARWLGLEPGWGSPDSVAIPAGTDTAVPLRLTTPPYIRPEQRHLILAIQDESGRHLANHVVSLQIENPNQFCDFGLGGGWIRLIDREGKDVGSWGPVHSLTPAPGEGFVQPIRPTNRGNFDDTLVLTIGGTAAPYLVDAPKTSEVAAGKTGSFGLRVRIPADAQPGTYTLTVHAHSQTYPAVQADWHGSYSVVKGKAE